MLSVKTDKIKLKNKENIFQNLILWILSFVSSVLFLLFYSTATSPLTSYYGEDSAFYAMVGAAMKHGMLPYRDFYEKAKEQVRIHFKKVTGHSGDHYNDMADQLAKQALGIK